MSGVQVPYTPPFNNITTQICKGKNAIDGKSQTNLLWKRREL
ncbi:hypothetical protein [Campylobacter blaseri]|nr:hypothetical protein [Campylobacter blaseri]